MATPEALVSACTPLPGPGQVQLVGLGHHLPATKVANADVGSVARVDDEWIFKRTGIRTRRRAAASTDVIDLATEASRLAIADAGLDPAAVDLILFATVSQPRPMPNAAPQLTSRLDTPNAAAFDIGAACNGFLAGLATAAAFIESSRASTVLVVAADTLSRQTDPYDRRTAPLFGDGAGAAVFTAADTASRWTIELGADGAGAELIANDPDTGLIRMDGPDTFVRAVAAMEQATRNVCATAGVPLTDIDLFVFHQANARITRTLTQRLALSPARVVDCIAEIGNVSAASVPVALTRARDERRLSHGDRVLLCAVGAGLTWGAALIDWTES